MMRLTTGDIGRGLGFVVSDSVDGGADWASTEGVHLYTCRLLAFSAAR
jgi:hypothetical protein